MIAQNNGSLIGSLVFLVGLIAVLVATAEAIAKPTSSAWKRWEDNDPWRHL